MLHADIDKSKWDACVLSSVQYKVYALSWYLDAITNNLWSAIIFEDYKYVFPLPYNDKIPFYKQVYTPLLTQQLGLFGIDNDPDIWRLAVLESIKRFKRIYLQLNDQVPYVMLGLLLPLKKRSNFIIDLGAPYKMISKSYSRNLNRNIKKAQEHELQIIEGPKPYTEDLFRQRYNYVPSSQVNSVRKLLNAISDHGALKIFQSMNKSGELLASAQFIIFRSRIIPLLSQTTDIGRENGAYHFLLDYIIQEHCESEYVFDFEGSDMTGVDSFMMSFGAVNKNYYALDVNNLPLVIKSYLGIRSHIRKD